MWALRQLAPGPVGKSRLSEVLGQKTIFGQPNKIIRVLVADQSSEFTLPDKPASRLQQYGLTEKGHSLLEKEKGGKS